VIVNSGSDGDSKSDARISNRVQICSRHRHLGASAVHRTIIIIIIIITGNKSSTSKAMHYRQDIVTYYAATRELS